VYQTLGGTARFPKEPQPRITLAARSTHRADLLHYSRCSNPCTCRHLATASILSGVRVVNAAESRTQRYAPATTTCWELPSQPSVPQLAVDISATRAPTTLVLACVAASKHRHARASPWGLQGAPAYSVWLTSCAYSKVNSPAAFFGSLSFSHHPLIRFVCHLTYLQTPGNSYSATQSWQRKDQSPSRLAHTRSLASMF
jgi:hypothetical protein